MTESRTPIPQRVGTTFSEALAARVHELERALTDTRRELGKTRKSRDLWKHRYETAAARRSRGRVA